jgi:hypothetical protein
MNAGAKAKNLKAMHKYEGMIIPTKFFGNCTVRNYKSRDNITVEFEDGTFVKTTVSQICRGSIKNPMHPNVRGVGFIGQGLYNSTNRKIAFRKWAAMFERCYCQKYLKIRPTYIGCKVSDDWHNFQNFAEWWDTQYYESGWHLDKDLLVSGNKIYSKDSCSLVPNEVNMLTVNNVNRMEFKRLAEKWKSKISTKLYESLVTRGGI